MRLSAALLGLLALAAPMAGAPQARIRAYILDCAEAHPADLPALVQGAGAVLQKACGIGLSLTAFSEIKGGCGLPGSREARRRALRALVRPLREAHPAELALLLLPGGPDPRYSYAWIDVSPEAGCGGPALPALLPRFGALFLTDFGLSTAASLDAGRGPDAPPAPKFATLLLAHEVLHALTHRPHATGLPAGHLMADSLGQMGSAVGQDWCDCARRSPYLKP